jgi:hypothetical protein
VSASGIYGNGGPHGARVWWPAGLQEKTPLERAQALQRGYWLHEGQVIHREGWVRPYTPSLRKAYPT